MPRHRPPGRAVSSKGRGTDSLTPREQILIICEGTETEPNYFNAIIAAHRLNTVKVDPQTALQISVEGTGMNTLTLVDYALSRQGNGRKRYAEIWCVFDKDDFPPANFDNAIARAQGHPFLRAAWSNESFELWYVLHFEYLNTSPAHGEGRRGKGKPRHFYCERLNGLVQSLGRTEYEKNDPTLYGLLGSQRLEQALNYARRLLDLYPAGTPCHQCKPATTVHLLVEKLLSYAPEYQPAYRTSD